MKLIQAVLLSLFFFISFSAISADGQQAVSSTKEPAKQEQKLEFKGAAEIQPSKVLANRLGYVGPCGGCASGPGGVCCPSTSRPVCEGSRCVCWRDSVCQ